MQRKVKSSILIVSHIDPSLAEMDFTRRRAGFASTNIIIGHINTSMSR